MKTPILHVEDDVSLQNLVRAALEHLGGYEVRTAANGPQVLELARQHPPRLVLLDLDLPGMSGIEVLRAMRGIEGLRRVPAIFLTAVVDPRVLAELRALDAQEVLQKPFRPRQLVETVARVLQETKD
jgi:CheY-like chemotaxis protein